MAGFFIAVQECSAGNESVGSEWLQTGSYPPETTLAEVWRWAQAQHGARGRLMICPDENNLPLKDDSVEF